MSKVTEVVQSIPHVVAWVWTSGQISIGETVPYGAQPLAKGTPADVRKVLRELTTVELAASADGVSVTDIEFCCNEIANAGTQQEKYTEFVALLLRMRVVVGKDRLQVSVPKPEAANRAARNKAINDVMSRRT